jgi:AhpD family alkylhydroperoxidase
MFCAKFGSHAAEPLIVRLPETSAFQNCRPELDSSYPQQPSKHLSRWRVVMEARFDYTKAAPGISRALAESERYLYTCSLEESLLNLVRLRASQINGCAFCIDVHWKEARAQGEREQRLYGLDAWRESPYYSERERAALAWAEEVTRVAENHVRDSVYEEVRPHFSFRELADLTFAIAVTNAWNRLSIATRKEAGMYLATGVNEPRRAV